MRALLISLNLILLLSLSSNFACARRQLSHSQRQDKYNALERERRHFRPHHQHRQWRLIKDGARYQLQANQQHYTFSFDYDSPDTCLQNNCIKGQTQILKIKHNGRELGRVYSQDKSLNISTKSSETQTLKAPILLSPVDDSENSDQPPRYRLDCDGPKRAKLSANEQPYFYLFDKQSAQNQQWFFKSYGPRQQRVTALHLLNDNSSFSGDPIDTPFPALASAIFYDEALELPWRTAIAIYISKFHFNCDLYSKNSTDEI